MLGREFTDEQIAKFLKLLSETGNVSKSAASIGIGRTAIYTRRNNDAAFKDLFEEALEIACDTLEEEGRRRALQGVEEVVVSAGKIVLDKEGSPLKVRRYSDTIWTTLMRAHRPDKFRDRSSVDLAGKDGGPIQVIIQGDDAAL